MPADRQVGSITGSFRPQRQRYLEGEPIWVRLRLTNRGASPLRYAVGGDYRGALWHNRYSLFLWDSKGNLLCDLMSDPPMNFGGIATTRVVGPGATVHADLLLNPACTALSEPGRYRITMVHVFAEFGALPRGCSSMSPPDVTQPNPAAVGSHKPACVQALGRFPALACDFEVEILPYNRPRLQQIFRALAKAERAMPPDGRNRHWYYVWAIKRFACAAEYATYANQRSAEDRALWVERIAAGLPARWPTKPCSPMEPGKGTPRPN